MKTRYAVLCVCWWNLALVSESADWPQFRGPNRDGKSAEKGLLKTWPKVGPPLSWTFDKTGLGYSSPAVVGDRLYIMAARGNSEYLVALDIKDQPKELWAAKIGPTFAWKGNTWNTGPNTTPTVDGDLIFALGGQGSLICVNKAGETQWAKKLPADMGAEVNPAGGGEEKLGWGFAWAPLVDGDRLVIVPGGKQGEVAALNKKDGKVLWQCKDLTGQATYASPVIANIGGVRQYVQLTLGADELVGVGGVAANDGKLLWHYKKKAKFTDCVIPTPVVRDDQVYYTVGFSYGCNLIKVAKKGDAFAVEDTAAYKATKVAKSVQNQSGGVVLVDDHIYGHSDTRGWVCQNLQTGAIVWDEKNKLGRGSVLFAEGNLYCYSEDDGVVALVEATPKGWSEKARFEIPKQSKQNLKSGRRWAHPVLANGKLYLRDQELLFCFDVAEKK